MQKVFTNRLYPSIVMPARFLPATLVIAMCCIVLVISATGQGMPHAVVGYVTDLSGNAVEGASVTIRNQRTGAELAVSANALGQYQTDLSSLSGGYQVGDTVTVRAVSGSMEGSSTVTVSSGALDQCDVVLDSEVSNGTPFPSLTAIVCTALVLSVLVGLAVRRGE